MRQFSVAMAATSNRSPPDIAWHSAHATSSLPRRPGAQGLAAIAHPGAPVSHEQVVPLQLRELQVGGLEPALHPWGVARVIDQEVVGNERERSITAANH